MIVGLNDQKGSAGTHRGTHRGSTSTHQHLWLSTIQDQLGWTHRGTHWVCFSAFQHWSCETAVLVFCTTIAMHRRFRGLRSKRIWITWWILAFSRGPATYTPTCRLNPVNYRTSNLGYIRIYTVEAKKLETGLRPNSAGIPYICIALIRIEATGFPAFRLLLYIYILETDPDLVDFLYLSIYIYIYICTDICCKFYMYYIYDSVLYYISV